MDKYQELSTRETDITINVDSICRTLNNLSKFHTEYVYCLVLCYYMENNNLSIDDLDTIIPYGGTVCTGGKGIKYVWSAIPSKLQKIIALYINDNKN